MLRPCIVAILVATGLVALVPRARATPASELLEELEDEEDNDGSAKLAPFEEAVPDAPAIRDLVAAAYAASGLDQNPTRSWTRRARVAGLIPWVTLRAAQDTTWQDRDPDLGHQTTLEARATWRLDRLLFDGRELEVASIEASRRRERRRLASRVIRTYFTWLRARSAAAHHIRWASHADEAAAELDALTDGWFTTALARGAASHPPPAASEPPSENRTP